MKNLLVGVFICMFFMGLCELIDKSFLGLTEENNWINSIHELVWWFSGGICFTVIQVILSDKTTNKDK